MKSSAKWVFITIKEKMNISLGNVCIPDYKKLNDSYTNLEKTSLENGFDDEPVTVDTNTKTEKLNPVPDSGLDKVEHTYTREWILDNLNDWATKRENLTYFFVEHDKDTNPSTNEPAEKHFHLIIDFGKNPVKFQALKDRFPHGQINPVRHKIKAVQYLIHLNSEKKHPYDWADVVTNGDINPYRVTLKSSDAINLNKIYEAIEKDEITKFNVTEKVPITLWAGNKANIENALEYRTEQITKNPYRPITVFYLQGPSHSGKSHWAYYNSLKMFPDHYPCDSAASNDPFQEYKGEKCIILNEFRDKKNEMSYQDVLKLLDPSYRSAIRSRYKNKHFVGEYIFITSVQPFNTWFEDIREVPTELFRRLTFIGVFSEDYITFKKWDSKKGVHVPAGRIPNTWSEKYCSAHMSDTPSLDGLSRLLAADDKVLNPTYSTLNSGLEDTLL